MSTEAFTHDVFLSHSAKEKALVRPSSLSASIGERAGVRCRSLDRTGWGWSAAPCCFAIRLTPAAASSRSCWPTAGEPARRRRVSYFDRERRVCYVACLWNCATTSPKNLERTVVGLDAGLGGLHWA